jgi:hypothetical protein
LIFNSIPTENGVSANVVIGQPDFVSNTVNNGGIGANTLSSVPGVYSDSTRLFIADMGNNRVLIYNSIPTSNDAVINADVVIGQPDFVSNTFNNGGLGANTLLNPYNIYSNGKKMIITDQGNHRILIYNLIHTPTNFTSISGSDNITLSVDSFSNSALTANKYYFSRSGANSGWIDSPSWTDTGLTCGTSYTYSVKYGTGDGMESESVSLVKSTANCSKSGGYRQDITKLLTPSTNSSTDSTIQTKQTNLSFNSNFKFGQTHNEIKMLQQFLNSHNFIISNSGAGSPNQETTYFGPLTFKALKAFQKSVGLPSTGFFGPMTRNYIKSMK